jgi:nitroreductase/NAD-dependent dihydropyrimidine dehydrogenase PreA subunit
MLQFKVDEKRCTQCGLCVQDCPFGVLAMDGMPVMAHPDDCLRCQHCLAICPTGALSILGNDPDTMTPLKKKSLPNADQMSVLIRGRRSTRIYKDEPLPADTMRELLETAWHAPTGVNSQQILLTVTDTREATTALRDKIYEKLEPALAEGGLPDTIAGNYLKIAVKMRRVHGLDIILRDAPHCIFVSAPPTAPSSPVDAHIFLSYFELLAGTMGIGTLWNGILKWAVCDVFPELRDRLGIPPDHEVGYAMIFGLPGVKYQRTVYRGPANINRVHPI